ncbi:MAG: PIN domain-containing protein [Burkholderiaceae bacterium]
MSRAVFVDTKVLLYCFDARDPAKRAAAQTWVSFCWQHHCGRLSTQVLNEFYSNARRNFTSAISAGDARAEVRRYQNWQPWAIDHGTVESAWAIESRFDLNYWDALIVASAQQQSCDHLLSVDLQHGQQIDGVQVVSPFTTTPQQIGLAS